MWIHLLGNMNANIEEIIKKLHHMSWFQSKPNQEEHNLTLDTKKGMGICQS